MPRLTDLAHLIVAHALGPGDIAIDATAGNGHDTAFLLSRVGPEGHVYAFDLQATAIATTRTRAGAAAPLTLVQASHETLAAHLPAGQHGRVGSVMFNLGYLPGGDKSVVTRPETTCAALGQALAVLRPGGLVTVLVYPGHPGGDAEAAAVRAFAGRLPAAWDVTRHRRLAGDRPTPELIVIERRH